MKAETSARNQFGLKPISKGYRVINGVRFRQWADVGTHEEAQRIVANDSLLFIEHVFIIRKAVDFYRVYRSENQ